MYLGRDVVAQVKVSLPYKQRAFIIYDNDVTLKICLSASSAFKVTVRDWFGYGEGKG